MNNIYIRMAIYTLGPLVALLPGVSLDQEAMTVLIDLERAAMGLSAALVAISAVFRKWAKR